MQRIKAIVFIALTLLDASLFAPAVHAGGRRSVCHVRTHARGWASSGGCASGSCGGSSFQGGCLTGQCQPQQLGMPSNCPGGSCPAPTSTVPTPAAIPGHSSALADVNAQRAARGLPPYVEDARLTASAFACASHRARFRISGHTQNDFAFVQGTSASTGGCAAWPQGMGFGACAMFEPGTRVAGAASVVGEDNLVYHQLFLQ